jgi:N-acetyl-beta-hexosaminidase
LGTARALLCADLSQRIYTCFDESFYFRYNLPDDVAHVAAYAMSRGVRLVLELDVPGHAASWGAGQPGVMADCEVTKHTC